MNVVLVTLGVRGLSQEVASHFAGQRAPSESQLLHLLSHSEEDDASPGLKQEDNAYLVGVELDEAERERQKRARRLPKGDHIQFRNLDMDGARQVMARVADLLILVEGSEGAVQDPVLFSRRVIPLQITGGAASFGWSRPSSVRKKLWNKVCVPGHPDALQVSQIQEISNTTLDIIKMMSEGDPMQPKVTPIKVIPDIDSLETYMKKFDAVYGFNG